MMTEHLAEADQPAPVEDRDRRAQVRYVSDTAGTVVGIVPEEDIALVNVVRSEIIENRLDEGGVGASGEFTAPGVEQGDAVVVLVPNHRRTRGALDRRLDFKLRGADGAGNDLELDRSQGRCLIRLRHCGFSMTRLPNRSQAIRHVTGTTMVEPYSSTINGPLNRTPGFRASRR